MGALRQPDLPSNSLEPRDRPQNTPSTPTQSLSLDRSFFFGVTAAVVGAVVLLVGVALASSATVWVAVALIALAGLALKFSLKTTTRPRIVRD